MSAQPATSLAHLRRPRLEPLEHEALLQRHQYAIDVLQHPEVHDLEHELPLEQREALLAAVVWPGEKFLAWSLARAQAKLERRLAG